MAKLNDHGGWDLTDEDAAEVIERSGNVCPECGSGVLASGLHLRDDVQCPRNELLERATFELHGVWLEHARLGTRGSPEEHCRRLARALLAADLLCSREDIAKALEARCTCYALTHPGHAHDCAMTMPAVAAMIRTGTA